VIHHAFRKLGNGSRSTNTRSAASPSLDDSTTVLGEVKGALAPLGGCAALDPACAPWEWA
jgi:hypothetical protein